MYNPNIFNPCHDYFIYTDFFYAKRECANVLLSYLKNVPKNMNTSFLETLEKKIKSQLSNEGDEGLYKEAMLTIINDFLCQNAYLKNLDNEK